jgi:anti-anti-sigma factor
VLQERTAREVLLAQHDHACWSYSTDEQRTDVIASYFAAGLHAGERLYYFASDGSEATALDGLADAGHDVRALIASGTLVIAEVESAYFPHSTFDARANLEGFRTIAQQALADGFTGIRVAAENATILNHPLIRDSWFEYELQVDALLATEPIVGLCAFDRRQCDPETLALLDAVHRVQVDPDGSAPHSGFHLHSAQDEVLVLSGDVDRFAVESLHRLLDSPVRKRHKITIDLSGLSFIDTAGMRALEELATERPSSYKKIRLTGVTDFQHHVWEATGNPRKLALLSP